MLQAQIALNNSFLEKKIYLKPLKLQLFYPNSSKLLVLVIGCSHAQKLQFEMFQIVANYYHIIGC